MTMGELTLAEAELGIDALVGLTNIIGASEAEVIVVGIDNLSIITAESAE